MNITQWTGTNAVNYFSPQIFESLGIKGTTATLFATGVYGAVKVWIKYDHSPKADQIL